MKSGNCSKISLIFSFIVLARNPVPSKFGREPLGQPIFEEEAGAGGIGTFVPTLTRGMRNDGKLHEWFVDTRTRQDQKARERENTLHVRTGNGLSPNGQGSLNSSVLASATVDK